MENQNPPFPPPPPQFPPNPPFPPPNPFMQNPMGGGGMELPNATAVLVLGIISIALCWCWGFIGLTCGIIALVLGNKGMNLYNQNPQGYTTKSYNNLKAGRICAIIGLALSAIDLILVIIGLISNEGRVYSPWNMHY